MWKSALRKTARFTVRNLVTSSLSRSAMNSLYLRLGPSSRTRFHREFARIFRDEAVRLMGPASWEVRFAGRSLRMPLTSASLWQEWDSAVSIMANDMEVKQTYEYLVVTQSPDLFVDVGANYGTHSLLFLAAGVETITFEPNSDCHDYFLRACALNAFKPQLEKIALGRERGRITLSYPPRDTWNGSTNQEAIARLQDDALMTKDVELRTLDDYFDRLRHSRRLLLKIDTEGNELAVLQGASRVLAECRPTVIFESLVGDANRQDLLASLESFGYAVGELPLAHGARAHPLRSEEFLRSQAMNFIGLRR